VQKGGGIRQVERVACKKVRRKRFLNACEKRGSVEEDSLHQAAMREASLFRKKINLASRKGKKKERDFEGSSFL